jgi:hypothetical protein
MTSLILKIARPGAISTGLFWLLSLNLSAQPFVPVDVGITVNGYQDDFGGTALGPNWTVRGASVFSVSGGLLHVTSAAGDPNHLLYELAGYDAAVQEVLARIRVTGFGTGDAARAGVGVGIDAGTSQGINYFFREVSGRHTSFLDDARAWGPDQGFVWQNNVWYWMRLRQEPNAASQGGVNDVFAKIWPADGSTVEPANWQLSWDYTPTRTTRTGYAGIAAGSLAGVSEFEVDYILIKAAGLPATLVAPNAFVQTPVAITNQPQSLTVRELFPASFSVGVSGNPQPTLQWYKNGALIPGATDTAYTVAMTPWSDHGALLQVVAANVVSNVTLSVTSSPATLTVLADTTPPVLLRAQSLGLDKVRARFSEWLAPAAATNPGNYSLTGPEGSLLIARAAPDATGTNVELAVSRMTENAAYTLTVNGLTDQSAAANRIATNSQAAFVARVFTPEDIGNPVPAGDSTITSDTFEVTGGGGNLGGTNDQLQFTYLARSGDFDVKVRVASLALSDAWAEAGLMARETLEPGSRFAGVLATPTISGAYFRSRSTVAGPAAASGSFPVNYPSTWLRLQRVGNQFNGYAGLDGQGWTLLGTVNLALPSTVFFGLAVSSHNTNQSTTAAFRELSEVTSVVTNMPPSDFEPLGQSSRRTSLVISEIMYHPANAMIGTNAARLEFIELFNTLSEPHDLSGYRLSGSVDYLFPAGTVLPGGGFLVVARAPADLEGFYGISGVLGPWEGAATNGLPNDAGTIRLRHRTGAVCLEVNYSTRPPWPVAADGAGPSLVLARPSYGEDSPRAWAASDAVGGSPGRLDAMTLDPLRAVVINEFLAHTGGLEPNFIELYNHSQQSLDISGCSLSDDAATNKFVVPPGTTLAARGFISYPQGQLGFGLKASGETIFLRNPAGTRVLDAVRFEAQAKGVSCGRHPDGAPDFRELSIPTPGAGNAEPVRRDIVINEIMYDPISRNDEDQYVELYNRGVDAVDLGGWQFIDAIAFTFASNTVIAPDGYLVIAKNTAHLMSNYPNLGPGKLVGNFSGKLAGGGEHLALARPEPVVSTNGHGFITNTMLVVVNEVNYGTGGRWPRWAAGGGSSLELIDPRSDNRLAPNWADSDETTKAPWTFVYNTGVVDNGNVSADQLQVVLQGPGECLIDDVEVLNASGVNLIANSSFESGAANWTAEGTESASGLETTEGFFSARSYHVRAVDRGDNQVNRIRTPLTSALPSGSTNTIRAKVRWLRGHPEILFRVRGNWLEAAGTMTLPATVGTPGAPNSRAVTNAPPAIDSVAHAPVLPAANQPVIVTARVNDPDGLGPVVLKYRLDPATNLVSVPMRDDGTGGDAVGGDGLYSATVAGQAAGVLVAFHVQASDGLTPAAISTFPNNAPAREGLIRFGENVPTGNFPVYRIWMTQATFNAWDARHNLDNTPNSVTFVLGGQRAIQGTLALFAGSPYIAPGFSTPSGNRCGYSITFPSDDRFLGSEDLVLDWPGGHGGESTGIQEQMAYWIADRMNLPFSHRHFIRLQVNGVTDLQRGGVFEAVLQPAGDYLAQWSFGDSQGEFYKIDRAFEFSDAGGTAADPMPQLQVFTTPNLREGGTMKKTERYRWNWLKRSFDTANNYTNLFALADALNAASPEPYTSQTEALVDVDEWMGVFAFEHIINNFDSWGHDIGKNMYSYRPQNGRWQLYAFDLDWLMLVSPRGPGSYTAATGPLFASNDPTVSRLYNHPPFRRAYFRAVQDAVNDPLISANCDPIMDAKYQSLVANGVTLCDGNALTDPSQVKTWFKERRNFLSGQLAAVAADFAISGTNSLVANSNLMALTGTAPVSVKTISVNGAEWPIVWTGLTTWALRVPVRPGTNLFAVQGFDARGHPVAGASNAVTVVYTGEAPSPQGIVVLNEVMFNPVLPDAEYVELFNTSSNFTFDLSGWRFNGLDYTFPPGSVMSPRSYLLLAKDRVAFDTAYGPAVVVFDEFAGNLQADGETLTLFMPGMTNGPDIVVDKVRYESVPPWPVGTNGVRTAASIQLIDPQQDHSRPCNWSTDYVPATWTDPIFFPGATNDGWRNVAVTGTVAANATNVLIWMQQAGDVYLDDVVLVRGDQAGVGANLLQNGDFESPFEAAWAFTAIATNLTNSAISPNLVHSGNASLHVVSTGAGGTTRAIAQVMPALGSNTLCTLSYWFYATYHGSNLIVRTLPGSGLNTTTNIQPVITPPSYTPARLLSPGTLALSPGAANPAATNLPPIPPLWLNEAQPENLTGITDAFGHRGPWIELYNAGTVEVALDGLFLSDNYTNLAQWAFPNGTSINPGEFKVIFVDGAADESTPEELHTPFRLSAGSGSVALSRLQHGSISVLDYLNYSDLLPDRSCGAFPDGQLFTRQAFYRATPGTNNDAASAPLVVRINEWMAANTRTLQNAENAGAYDDWFELYNPGDAPAALEGCYLTDALADKFQFRIPAGFVVEPHGFLLVWADNQPGLNGAGATSLHVNFQLSRNGEAIGLSAADGTPIDTVTFGVQTNDVSEGRYPDGAANRYLMPTPTPQQPNVASEPPSWPRLEGVTLLGQNSLQFSITVPAGVPYQVQYTEDLSAGQWISLGEPQTGTGAGVIITDDFGQRTQRFYRVLLWP